MTSSYTILLLFQVQIHSTIIFISILSKRLNIILSSAYRRPIIVVFSVTIIFAKFRRGPPLTIGCRWDEKNRHFNKYLALSQKWYKIWPYLLWNANRKSYTRFWMVQFSMTLSDLWRSFRVQLLGYFVCAADAWPVLIVMVIACNGQSLTNQVIHIKYFAVFKPQLAIARLRLYASELSICLSVCRQNAKKRDFLKN